VSVSDAPSTLFIVWMDSLTLILELGNDCGHGWLARMESSLESTIGMVVGAGRGNSIVWMCF